jgi:hypothetical protein
VCTSSPHSTDFHSSRRHWRIANLIDSVTALINNVSIHGFAAHVDITSTCRNVTSINDFVAHVDNTNACRDIESTNSLAAHIDSTSACKGIGSTNGFAVHVNDTLRLQFCSPSPPRAHNSAPSFVRERDSSLFDSFSPKEATCSTLNYTFSISFPFERSKMTVEIPTTTFWAYTCQPFYYHIFPQRPIIPCDIVDVVLSLWRDPGVKEAVRHSRKFQLNNSAVYYFNSIEHMAAMNYIPTDQDILKSRVKMTFKVGKLTYKLFDPRLVFALEPIG